MGLSNENSVTVETRRILGREYIGFGAIAFLVVFSFCVSRVPFFGTFYPCGIALIAVAIKRNSLNIYLLPALVLGLCTYCSKHVYFWGDLVATVCAAVVFLVIYKRTINDFYRIVLCVSIAIISNIGYYTLTGTLYKMNMEMLFLEAISIVALFYIFDVAMSIFQLKEKYEASRENGIASIALICILFFCGLFIWGGEYEMSAYVPIGAGLFITLLMGTKLGISSGVITGASTGIVLSICASMPISQLVIFICGGMAAGMFKDMNKYTASICFAAICVGFSLTTTGSMFAMPVFIPIVAAVVMMLIPQVLMNKINAVLCKLTKEEEMVSAPINTNEYIRVLDGYKTCFRSLAQLYSTQKNSRSIISYQFRGMEQVVEKLERDIKMVDKNRITYVAAPDSQRYLMNAVTSSYAKTGGISGDSYICRELKDGKYILILSDGMGKGERAAAESNLTVTTLANLIEAGFDVEVALKTLNSILLLKSEEEIFATVDIGIFDPNSGKIRLYKVGAASTFIKRGMKVEAVKMAALPLGIVDGLHIDFVNVRLRPGDQLIMVSDGIIDSKREISVPDADWLSQTILSIKSKDPQTMADLIVNKAIENYGLREKDDLTIISAIIK